MHVFILLNIDEFKSRNVVMGVFTTMESAKAFFDKDGNDAPEWDLTTLGQENWAITTDESESYEIHKHEVKS
jgi:hypothetical protein